MGAERLTAAVAAALVLLAAGCEDGGSSDSATTAPRTAIVARVNDGDTLTLRGGEQVRLVQIDAPELTEDCFGRAALQALASLVRDGARVRLVRDPALDDRDRFGRLLRYVESRGTDVNVELVRRGAAAPYFFRNERGAHAEELLAAARAARAERRGFWGACPGARLNPGLGSLTGPA